VFVPLAIFLLSYVLIASRRVPWLPIGRTAGALLGAVLMVVCGVVTPAQAYAAIDHDTLALLLGMMLLTAYLDRAGVLDQVGERVLARAGSPGALLVRVALLSGLLSALLVNDTVCLFLTPVVVRTCRRHGLPMTPYLMALATSANLGSSATLVGNPQNMLIGSMSGLAFTRFLALVGPTAAVALVANTALLWLFYRRALAGSTVVAPQEPPVPRTADGARVVAVLVGVAAAFLGGAHLGFAALGGAVLLMVWDRQEPRDVFAAVDWSLLVFFAGLFVVVGGLASTGLVDAAWAQLAPSLRLDTARGALAFSGVMTVGSNLVSNVPLVLLAGPNLDALGGGALGWAMLGYVTTVAGNLTLVGSVANLIVAEGAREHHDLGFVEYLRFGLPSTLVSLAVGVPFLMWAAA
jgi:Na+/H+ antiporter NhaD/arsenite permease-like protein